ncbi:hypothetical protein KUV51_01370 [Tateyamaria omphalii]|uniref:hypothetical protein n=1 Tax=Tateyamaria omphalii TaxID=299262 RepID=UPI001C999284|nr:hypothetical protein [Tateyamaria omphalii]MBY5931632.1 hypothetical protein [Tateyamaria omphalii]
MTQDFQKFWLKITALVIGGFAPVMLLGTMTATSAPLQFTMDVLGMPLDGLPLYGDDASRFLAAIMGGLMLGWGATIWCLQAWVYDAAPEGVRRTVVTGLCLWFVLDGIGSVLAGQASNVLFNLLILVSAIGPLWRPARATVLS